VEGVGVIASRTRSLAIVSSSRRVLGGVPGARVGETQRFANTCPGHPEGMRTKLVFVRRYRSGASRKMESLVAWVKVTQKRRLDVVELDADRHHRLVAQLGVKSAPSLVLVKDRRVVGRLEGRASGRQIEELIRPHL
jgi:hypothetical protein